MYKCGRYGIYHGKEYSVNRDTAGNHKIYTKDQNKIDSDFVDTYHSGTYSKVIQLEELEEYYDITSYVVIDGQDFLIVRENTEYYWLGTSNKEKAKKYGFKMVDRGCYERKVRKDSAEVWERRKEL